MAETDNNAIKKAFLGLLVLFAIFVLAGWLFDNLTKAEGSNLSIAVYAPSVSESQWGKASKGLRCKLNFNRNDPSQFVDISINIQYENISDQDIVLLCDPNQILKAVTAVNSDGWKLKLVPIPREFFFNQDEYDELYQVSVHTIKPGEIFDNKIECQIDNAKKDGGFISGFFDVTYAQEIDNSAVSKYQSDSGLIFWTGKIKAGNCQIFLTMPHDGGCNDCHGDADYHHGLGQDCRFCHAEGTAIMHKTCIRCHKRDDQKIYGRRRVMGPGGDFDNVSKHISGIIEDRDCLVCHDMTRHGYGEVILANPSSSGPKIFTDNYTEFCLTCHNSNPPEGVVFPEEKPDNNMSDPYGGYGSEYGNDSGYGYSDDYGYGSEYGDDSGLNDDFGYGSEYGDDTGLNNDFGYGSEDTSLEYSESNLGGLAHSDPNESIYNKSDFLNSDLYKMNVECTDCHRSHGSDRPSLLKNVHGPDDKIRI